MRRRVGGAVFIKHIQGMVEYRDYPYNFLLENRGGETECLQSVDSFIDLWIAE